MSFHVRKWYVDCTDHLGRTAIAYWVSLSWKDITFTWHSADVYELDGAPDRQWSLAPVPEPVETDGVLAWNSTRLGCATTLQARCAPVRAVLLENEDGRVDWRCAVPLGLAAFALPGHAPVRGSAYAECLDLTIPPWRLPISELRWGRWGDADTGRSLVWIDWRGPANQTWAYLDGRKVSATVTDESVRTPDGSILTLRSKRTLVSRTLADLVRPIPTLGPLLPASLMALSETKWSGVGTLRKGTAAPIEAPALFEVVHMRPATS